MDITIKNLQTRIPIRLTRIKKVACHALQYLRMFNAELSIVLVTSQRMKIINAHYLKHNFSTDILTFDYRSLKANDFQVEIIICPSKAAQNAVVYKTTIEEEIDLYVVHGLLHLAGYNDHSSRDIKRIRSKEKEIIKSLKSKFAKK